MNSNVGTQAPYDGSVTLSLAPERVRDGWSPGWRPSELVILDVAGATARCPARGGGRRRRRTSSPTSWPASILGLARCALRRSGSSSTAAGWSSVDRRCVRPDTQGWCPSATTDRAWPWSPLDMALCQDEDELAGLLGDARKGDRAAIEELFVRCGPMMLRTAQRIAPARADAEDAVQEAWATFLEHIVDIRRPESLAAWLWQVTRHAAHRCCASAGPACAEVRLEDLPSPESTEDDVTTRITTSERASAVGAALHGLGERDRELLSLLTADDRPSYVEIGRRLGRPIGSIGPTRQRIIGRLRADLGISLLQRAGADG